MIDQERVKYEGIKGAPVIREPGNAVKVHTGLWKTHEPVTDYGKCVACRMCLLYCPISCIHWDKKKNLPRTDQFTCKGCGVCADVCPVKCIRMAEVCQI